jgi:hypothetical protein
MPVNWAAATLATDADLTAQESRMPGLATQTVHPNGQTAFNGKRALAKRDIESWVKRQGISPDDLANVTQFNRLAVFMELAYIFRDMQHLNNQTAGEKADYYQGLMEDELKAIVIEYTPTKEPFSEQTTIGRIQLRRG